MARSFSWATMRLTTTCVIIRCCWRASEINSALLRPPACKRSLDCARGDVHHERQHRDVEHKRDDAVRGDGPSDVFRGDRDVGDLRGHADDEREIDEVPVVRLLVARKTESSTAGTSLVVKLVRVVKRKDGVHEGP